MEVMISAVATLEVATSDPVNILTLTSFAHIDTSLELLASAVRMGTTAEVRMFRSRFRLCKFSIYIM